MNLEDLKSKVTETNHKKRGYSKKSLEAHPTKTSEDIHGKCKDRLNNAIKRIIALEESIKGLNNNEIPEHIENTLKIYKEQYNKVQAQIQELINGKNNRADSGFVSRRAFESASGLWKAINELKSTLLK